MPIDVNNPYVRTKIMTASREELRLMLIEGCIDFLRTGRQAIVEKQWETVYKSFTDAKNIIVELMNSLKHDVAPELCHNLQSLYTYMYTTVTEGSFEKDTDKIDEVIKLMEYERETWVMLMEKLKSEMAGGGSDAPQQAPPATGTHGPASPHSQHSSLSIEG
jgi:flagellar protein FliS